MRRVNGGPALLVSVRSAGEAAEALAGGAALIDVKEPDRGSLGRATDDTIADILETVAGRRPVSAALGELLEGTPLPAQVHQLAFVKWGLAGCRGRDWKTLLRTQFSRLAEQAPTCRPVVVAYADHLRAEAPEPSEVCTFVERHQGSVLLLDTWKKDGKTLLSWMLPIRLYVLCRRCYEAERSIALAGSLHAEQIDCLKSMRPDWFAVRGAACAEGQRTAAIDRERVRSLAALLR